MSVYDSGGFSAAAAKIQISQPAITKSIQELEVELGVKLFERSPKGAAPTVFADILARRLRLMDIEYRLALAEIAAAKGSREGELRIGAGPAWYSTLLPPILRSFTSKYPDIHLRVESGVIGHLIQRLEDGEFDIVCTSFDFPNRPYLVKEPTMAIQHSVVAAALHPLTKLPVAEPEQLCAYPWVTLVDDHIGTGRVLSYFAEHGCPPPNLLAQTSSLTMLKDLVSSGDYLAHMPQVMLPTASLQDIVALPITGTFWETTTGIIYHQTQYKSASLKRFISEIRQHYVR